MVIFYENNSISKAQVSLIARTDYPKCRKHSEWKSLHILLRVFANR